MPLLWRISNYADLNGKGGELYSARWNTRGLPVVYLADSPSSAVLEVLVHLELLRGDMPTNYWLLEVHASDDSSITDLSPKLQRDWRTQIASTRAAGDAWLASKVSVLAKVPSAIVPFTWNYLFNPKHPDAAQVRIAGHTQHPFDGRLMERRVLGS